jgi:outer membrane protein OmpA-like peptidoglycan-associated protein
MWTLRIPKPKKAPNAVSAACSVDGSSVMADSNQAVMASVKSSNTYAFPMNYSWTATGGKVDGTGPQARWDSTGVAPGTYTISARVDDGHGASASCSSDVTVNPKPVPPPPTMSCSADPSSVQVGGRSTVTATANNSTGTALTYTWQANSGQVVGTGASVQFDSTGLAAGDYTVTGRVTNGNGAAADCSATVSVQAPPPAPQASKIGSCNFKAGSSKVDNVCKRVLDDAAVRLQNDPKATVVLIGYADPSEKKPDTLSKARGDNTSQYLSKTKGVAESRTQSRTAAGTAGAGQENYRVDVMFVPDGATF